ncbi:APC family permease [Brasilonema sp. CT11]|nr:APC family permease [Brasilonema sp. CT11]
MFFFSGIKRLLVGRSLPTSAHAEERLNNFAALAVLSSDAISSVAFATEEVLKVLVLAGSAALGLSIWVAVAIVLLLLIITLSYRQTIRAYPSGGGAYIVARENLGLYPGLVASASLMIDYVLTVSVNIALGVDNLLSIPELQPLRYLKIELCLLFIFLIMVANLRGIRESGRIFMVPTYAFVLIALITIASGFYQEAFGNISANPPAIQAAEPFIVR